jgi:hypothetical protein
MKFNLRQATWVFVISAALLATPGFANGYPPQDNRAGQDRGQDDKRGEQQQGDRRDNGQGNQQGDRRDGDHRRGEPEGGYRQTCRDIQVSGNTLQATCEKRSGKWKQTSLRNFNRCTDQIENNNGKLVCNR